MSQNLNLLNSEILGVISTVAGISRTPTEWSAADKSDVRQAIRRGMRKFYQPQPLPNSTIHQWRFLERKMYVSAEEPYTTGVLKVSAGTAILVGGTWPSWSLDAVLNTGQNVLYVTGVSGSNRTVDNTAADSLSITFDGGATSATTTGASDLLTIVGHTVVAADLNKILQITAGTNFITGQYMVNAIDTVNNTWTLSAAATTGSGSGMVGATGYKFTAYRYRYPLAADFAEFIGAVTYSGGNHTKMLRNTSDEEIRLRWSYQNNCRADHCAVYSIQHGRSVDGLVGTTGEDANKWYISFWPALQSMSSVTAIYRTSPLDGLNAVDITNTAETGYITNVLDAVHAETLMAAILSAVDEIYNDRMDGIYHSLFLTRLAASIAHDRHVQGNQDFGSHHGHRHFNHRAFYLLNHLPTYDVI